MSDAGLGELEDVRVAKLPAVVDVSNALDVHAGLAALVVDGVSVLIADMAATTRLSLEGLHVLVLVRTKAARHEAELRLAALQPDVRRFMDLTGTGRLFSLYDSVDLASG